MKPLYVEAALDAYKYLDRNIKLLDTKIIRKAMGSVRNYDKSCEELAIDIIELQTLKFRLIDLKKAIDETLAELSQNGRTYAYRNYMHVPISYEHSVRNLKNPKRILSKFGFAMERNNIDSETFEEMLKLKVIKDSLAHVKQKTR